MKDFLKLTNVQYDVSGLRRLKFIIDFCEKNPGRVLDVGCGTGSVSIPLGLWCEVDGIDVDSASVDIAVKRNPLKSVNFSVMDISGVKCMYDVVLCTQVLEHLENPGGMMAELARVSKRFVIITVPNGYGAGEVVGRIIGMFRGAGRGTAKLKSSTRTNDGMFTANPAGHVQKFTLRKVLALADGAGFFVRQIKSHNFLLSAFPFNQLFFHTPFKRFFERVDEAVADIIPKFMAGGWYFVLEKK